MHCRTPESCQFKRSLGFKLHNVINCKEQTVLKSIKDKISIKEKICRFNTVS